MYGLLAEAGRAEDNASLGGQVAHISAEEADLLRRLGGAGSVNPTTGLPEYYTSGVTGNPAAATAAAATAAQGSANAAANSAANAAATSAANAIGNVGISTIGQYGGPRGNPPSSNAPTTSSATNQGLSVSPLASSTYGRVAQLANSNIAADPGLVGQGLFGQLGHVLGKAATTSIFGFLGDSGALGPAVQAMVRGTTTPPYGGEGSAAAGTSQGTSGTSSANTGGILDVGLPQISTGLPQNVTNPGISLA